MDANTVTTWAHPPRSAFQELLAEVGLAAATVAVWWLWLGHDTTYQADGNGPYESWQVVGCGVTFLLLAFASGLWLRWPPLSVALMALSFTVAWSVPASADRTGLWAVGALMVAVGTTFGAVVGVGLGTVARRPQRLRAHDLGPWLPR